MIEKRLDEGLSLLRQYYTVEECAVDPVLANPVIGGRLHHARRYDIRGVGNLLAMTVTEAAENQLSSFVITPYYKNLPLFSTDYVYSGDRRFFLLEIYDLSVARDEPFNAGIEAFRAFRQKIADLPDIPVRSAWYDDIRPVCYAKAPAAELDELSIDRFLEFLALFIQMEQTAPALPEDVLPEKWRRNKAYADRLIDAGGVSTDLFTAALGAENTRRFFHEVFFGADCYRPAAEGGLPAVSMKGVEDFLAFRDEDGLTNLDKIQANQRIIRRVATTDKSKSYEEADDVQAAGEYPPGIVLDGGRLIGFGIHIFNEDVYPLKSFEIYFRNCGLAGDLDLSGMEDLIFIDVYHNRIRSVRLEGLKSLRILGLQDNRIERLDVSQMPACQGIDAGRNRLKTIDTSHNPKLVELYINDNDIECVDLSHNARLKYFYCHNNRIRNLDATANPLLRHLNATGNPLIEIKAYAPQRDELLPLEISAGEGGCIGMQFNPIYNAQWKETGEWQQTYYAYPDEGRVFDCWMEAGEPVSTEPVLQDEYGSSRQLIAKFK